MKLADRVRLREVVAGDERLLFDWANDEAVRVNAINSEKIIWEVHKKWFQNKLSDKNITQIYIVENGDGHLIGQIRFDRQVDEAVIDYSIDKNFRGKGYGASILEYGERKIKKVWPDIERLVGVVKPENLVSRKCFKKAGFTEKKEKNLLKFIKDMTNER